MNLTTHLDLFSGIGGFAIAAQRAGFQTIGFSEIDSYACKILKRHWPDVQNFGDIKNVTRKAVADAKCVRQSQSQGSESDERRRVGNGGEQTGRGYGSLVDIITGGFPCQPFSFAGKRRGKEDHRSLWPEMLRVIDECRPRWVLGENVVGIVSMELDNVLSDLENIGYSARPIVIPACAVDARHRRNRVWIMAHSEREGSNQRFDTSMQRGWSEESSGSLANTNEPGSQGRNIEELQERGCERTSREGGTSVPITARQLSHRSGESRNWSEQSSDCCEWLPEPAVGRVADGIPNRSHRLKGLGNAIVPQVAEIILRGMADAFQSSLPS